MPDSVLSVKFGSYRDVQNLVNSFGSPSVDLPSENLTISPLNIARYFLFTRQLPSQSYGIGDINGHLNYEGGFITAGDRVNSKHSSFTVERTLTVNTSSTFLRGFDVANSSGQRVNRIVNLRKLPDPGTIDAFISEIYDNRVMTVGDFKKMTYYKGMIMLWSGSYQTLVNNLPLWRLCAPPDTDNYPEVPNLLNRFVLAGSYFDYEIKDNLDRPFGDPVLKINAAPTSPLPKTGGSNTVVIQNIHLPQHNHNNTLEIEGGTFEMSPSPRINKFVTGGGGLEIADDIGHVAGGNFIPKSGISRNDYLRTTLSFDTTTNPFVWPNADNKPSDYNDLFSEKDKGEDGAHENKPPYYALAYIYYYGSPR